MSAAAAPDGLASERLWLRRMEARDVAVLLAYRNDPEVARYQGWGDAFSAEQAEEMLAAQTELRPGTPGAWFRWMLEERASGAVVGDCAMCVDGDDPRQAEIGFSLAREHQRRGFAAEAVRRLLDYAFGELTLHRVVAITDARNAAAAALLARVGMRREAHFIQNSWYKGAWGDEFLFAILRSEWR
ncbi:MAG TPA: GNAT family protein [Longimicrobium sp.]|nr:GNAT family protein [Longimicrobium sp.]